MAIDELDPDSLAEESVELTTPRVDAYVRVVASAITQLRGFSTEILPQVPGGGGWANLMYGYPAIGVDNDFL